MTNELVISELTDASVNLLKRSKLADTFDVIFVGEFIYVEVSSPTYRHFHIVIIRAPNGYIITH